MADDNPRQRRPVGPNGRLMPHGRPWQRGQSGNPRGPVRKPRAVKDRAIADFVTQLNSLMSLQTEVYLMRESLKLQGEMIDSILSVITTYDSGGMTDAEIVSKAREIAQREIERRQQQAAGK